MMEIDVSKEEFLKKARTQFGIVGPVITEETVAETFPGAFPGKEDLANFYLQNNGGCRSSSGCLTFCGNPAHRISRGELGKLRIEGFFAVLNPGEKALRYRSMRKYLQSTVDTFAEIPEMKAFLESHRPIAIDHTGNDCWIDLQSGCVRLVFWDSWEQGPLLIASSFREFVINFWNKTVDDPDVTSL